MQGHSIIYYVTESAQNTPHTTRERGTYVKNANLHVCAILMKEAESSVPWEERKESFFFFSFLGFHLFRDTEMRGSFSLMGQEIGEGGEHL